MQKDQPFGSTFRGVTVQLPKKQPYKEPWTARRVREIEEAVAALQAVQHEWIEKKVLGEVVDADTFFGVTIDKKDVERAASQEADRKRILSATLKKLAKIQDECLKKAKTT